MQTLNPDGTMILHPKISLTIAIIIALLCTGAL